MAASSGAAVGSTEEVIAAAPPSHFVVTVTREPAATSTGSPMTGQPSALRVDSRLTRSSRPRVSTMTAQDLPVAAQAASRLARDCLW